MPRSCATEISGLIASISLSRLAPSIICGLGLEHVDDDQRRPLAEPDPQPETTLLEELRIALGCLLTHGRCSAPCFCDASLAPGPGTCRLPLNRSKPLPTGRRWPW